MSDLHAELVASVKILLATHPVFRTRFIGGPNSEARMHQQDQIIAEDAVSNILAKIAAAPRITLGVVVEGGMIQSVVSDNPLALAAVDVVVIDYDTDDADETTLYQVRQGDGSLSTAHVHAEAIDPAAIDLRSALDQLEE